MSTRTAQLLNQFYDAMYESLGPQHWWPAQTPTEVMIGAILTQNTAWRNVERAILNLQTADALDWHKLAQMPIEELAALIRPAGTFNVKSRRLKAFAEWFVSEFDGNLDQLFATPVGSLREMLLSVHGIGRETADAIILYAGALPSFVVDAYTARILYRHQLIDSDADYDEIKDLFESNLPEDTQLFNEYHALLVEVGKRYCRPKARCSGCPLEPFDHELEFFD